MPIMKNIELFFSKSALGFFLESIKNQNDVVRVGSSMWNNQAKARCDTTSISTKLKEPEVLAKKSNQSPTLPGT